MADSDKHPRLGQVVRIKRGRDAGNLAVIVKIENDKFVYIADGDKRKFDHPKKKNLVHLEFMDYVSSEVADCLRQTGRVTSAKLRYALAKFQEQHPGFEVQTKGE